MPHIIIEHPSIKNNDIDLADLSNSLHNYLAEHESIKTPAIKTRTVLVDNVFVGEEATSNEFIHITILLLSGRTQLLKETIVKNIYNKAKNFIPETYTLSVETRDLGVYYKG